MKVAGMRELRAKSATLFGKGEPLLVTRHGRISGVYVPLDEPDRLPDDLRRELAGVVGRHLAKLLDRKGVAERNIAEDFHAHRRRRR
jgi:antitoxin (DNA-binding transcriptional repressor) of toxin-antitoxin stability system